MALYDEEFDYSAYIDQAQPFEQGKYAQVEGYEKLEKAYGDALGALEGALTGDLYTQLRILLVSRKAIARCRERHFFAQGCRLAFEQTEEALNCAVERLEQEEREEEKE